MTCPNCDRLTAENAALRERADLVEALQASEHALNTALVNEVAFRRQAQERAADLDDQLNLSKSRIAALEEALRFFLADDRFQVAVGGNPIAVDEMLAKARAALSPAEERK